MKTLLLILYTTSTILAQQLPEAPSDLQVEILYSSGARLTWKDNSDNELGYKIERRVHNKRGGWKLVGSVPTNVTAFESTGMLAGSDKYQHRVYPYNELGSGAGISTKVIRMPEPDEEPNGKLIIKSNAEKPRSGEGSLIKLKNGDLVYYFISFLGVHSDFAHGAVYKKISKDNGSSWSEPIQVFRDEKVRYARVAAARLANGDIGISYGYHKPEVVQEGIQHTPGEGDRVTVVFRYSKNEGKTWSEEQFIGDDPTYPSAHSLWNSLHLLSNGRIITMIQCSQDHEARYGTYFRISDNHGRTWKRVPEVGRFEVLENPFDNDEYGLWEVALVEYEKGKLLAHGRSATGRLYEFRSDDFGSSWSKPKQLLVPHPKAPPYLGKIPGTKTIFKIWNPHVDPNDHTWNNWSLGLRVILAMQLSDDGGTTWYGYKELEYHNNSDWYCYPSTLWVGDSLHLVYFDQPRHKENMNKRTNVRYQKLSKEWVLNK